MIEKLSDKMGEIHCNFCECKNICLHIILSILFTPKNILLFIIFFKMILFYFYAFISFRSFPNNYWDKFVKRKVGLNFLFFS